MERRRRAAPSVVPGPARRQEGDRRRPRGAASRRPQGTQPKAAAPTARDRGRREARSASPRKVSHESRQREHRSHRASRPPRRDSGQRRRTASTPWRSRRSRIPTSSTFPKPGITKLEVARYYERIAPRILPHVEGRPLSLVRCPDGWKRQCFYQKHADKSVNPAVDRIEVPEGGGDRDVHGRAAARRRSSRSCSGACSNCIRGDRARRGSTGPIG